METGRVIGVSVVSMTSETSLEGWKQGKAHERAGNRADFRNFLRGMETKFIVATECIVAILPKLP